MDRLEQAMQRHAALREEVAELADDAACDPEVRAVLDFAPAANEYPDDLDEFKAEMLTRHSEHLEERIESLRPKARRARTRRRDSALGLRRFSPFHLAKWERQEAERREARKAARNRPSGNAAKRASATASAAEMAQRVDRIR